MHTAIALAIAALATAFVLVAGAELPDPVVSRFDLTGRARGAMGKTWFLALIVFLAGVLPLLVWALQVRLARGGQTRIPQAAQWFSPRHRQATERWLTGHATLFCAVTAVFMCFVCWLAVLAHRQTPPMLPPGPFLVALGLYLGFTVVWGLAPQRHFRRGP